MGRLSARRAVRAGLAAGSAAGFLLVLGVAGAGTARAADASFGAPTAEATWGEGIEFVQPVTLGGDVRRVEILIEFPDGDGPVVDVPEADPQEGQQTLRHTLLVADGHMTPNTTLTARWRVVGEDGSEVVGPPVSVLYEDTRFEWRVREGDLVRVHWYEGPDSFGDRALEIAERTVRETSELLGTTEEDPVDFFVYADQQAFYDAIGPGLRENVGGLAIPSLRSLFGLIPSDQIDDEWVGIVIPHEMVHLVFDTATDNPYHFPPRWLNEGVAVYLSEGYGLTDRAAVEQAVDDGSLIPLEGLTGQFPTSAERFFLAYSESVSAVDFLVREHGRDAFVSLVRSYAEGLTDDEAFERAIGMDVEAFDTAWREELGAGEPEIHGPVDPPAGPLPPGWTDAQGSPGASLPPGSRPTGGLGAPASPTSPGGEDPTGGMFPLAIAAVAAVAVAALGLYVLAVRGRHERVHAAEAAHAGVVDDGAPWAGSVGQEVPAPSRSSEEGGGERAAAAAAAEVVGERPPAEPAPATEPRAEPGVVTEPLPASSEAVEQTQPPVETAATAVTATPADDALPPGTDAPAPDGAVAPAATRPEPAAAARPVTPDYLPSGELWPSGWSTPDAPTPVGGEVVAGGVSVPVESAPPSAATPDAVPRDDQPADRPPRAEPPPGP